jgi:hypothetical protein
MRIILGMILGALLTIGAAYVLDGGRVEAGTATAERPMVNWDVVGKNWDRLTTRVRSEFTRLTSG